MTHPANDDYENNEPFSSPCSAPPITPIDETLEQEPNTSPEPANENTAETMPTPQTEALQSFERQAEDSFRMAIGGNTEAVKEFYSSTTEAYENVSQALRASAEGFTSALTQLNWKLFEFGRINAQNNLNYVRNVSGVRNMRDLVDVQTSYMREQYDALTQQMRELQSLTTELASKTAGPFKDQIARAAQLPRIC